MKLERHISQAGNTQEPTSPAPFNSKTSQGKFFQGLKHPGNFTRAAVIGTVLAVGAQEAEPILASSIQASVTNSEHTIVWEAPTLEESGFTLSFDYSTESADDRELQAIAGPTGNPYFDRVWTQSDEAVANGSDPERTWMWGPEAITDIVEESYGEAPNGKRVVVYFDKSRMEITHPDGNPNSEWYVTNGLLTTELITGQLQVGDNEFIERSPAQIQIAGDPGDPNAPTYATFSQNPNLLSPKEYKGPGVPIHERIDKDGKVTNDQQYAIYGQTLSSEFVPATGHQVAQVFLDEMYEQLESGTIPNLYYPYGYPLSEPYWVTVNVGGQRRDVMVQMFQRRVMTYTPSNPDKWQVETGNVGQHYYKWRYGREPQRLEQNERQMLSQTQQNFENVLNPYLQQKDTPIFDRQFTNNLPAHFDRYMKEERWWMGSYLPNTGLMYGLSGDTDQAYSHIKKSWDYKKEHMDLLYGRNGLPSDNKTTEVFIFYEDMFALKLLGNDLMDKDPRMVQEKLDQLERLANNYATQNPPGNDASNIRSNSYGETNAGIAALLMGMASLEPTNPNRQLWVDSAHKYAKGAFAVNDRIGNQTISTAVEEGDELWVYNHGVKNAAYTLTTIGQLELAKLYGLSAGIPVGDEFFHNVDRAFATVMKYIDENDLYTLEQNKPFFGYDEYMLGPEHQAYFVDVDDKASVLRLSRNHVVDFKIPDLKPSQGVFSDEFQKGVDPLFAQDCIRYFESLEYQRIVIKSIMAQMMLGRVPTINGRRISFFTNYSN